MKRIALISEHASPVAILGGINNGGQNVYVGAIARQLVSLGFQVDIFTRRDAPTHPAIRMWENGVRIFYINAGPAEYVPKEELFQYMDEFASNTIRIFQEQSQPYELVHANFWMSGWVAIQIKEKLGIPFVVTFHALGRVRRQHQGKDDGFPDLRFEVEDEVVRAADWIIAECPQDFDDLERLYGASPEKIRVVPCGVDRHEVWPVAKFEARRYLGLPRNATVILQLGRMVPRKGVDNVIRGLGRLKRKHHIEARLVIVGGEVDEPGMEPANEIERLKEIAREEGVSEQVYFAGQKDRQELKYYYSAADVFVSTPWYEPFGITPLEAMACGTPVIGSNVGGIKYSVADGETGLLVPPKDPDRLANALVTLLDNPDLLAKFGRNAIRRVNEYFTWEKVAEMIAELYLETLERSDMDLGMAALNGGYASAKKQLAVVERVFSDAQTALHSSEDQLSPLILKAADILTDCLVKGGRVFVCGNGGSAADAQHFAAEFVGRFQLKGRKALPVMALTTDTATITAWANDAGYEKVFARQVEAFLRPGDVLMGISTSGRSENVLEALRAARALGGVCIALTGGDGGQLVLEPNEVNLIVPSNNTARIQEVHMVVLHVLCELVEERFVYSSEASPHGAEIFLAPNSEPRNGPLRPKTTVIAGINGKRPGKRSWLSSGFHRNS